MPVLVRIPESILYQQVGDGLVLLNRNTQEYYSLDEVGSEIWRQLAANGSVASAVQHLTQVYDAAEEIMARDVSALVSKLVTEKLLVELEAP